MQAHSCAGPKSCEAKHGEPSFMKNGSKAQSKDHVPQAGSHIHIHENEKITNQWKN